MAKYCTWVTEEPRYQQCHNLAIAGTYRCAEHPAQKIRRIGNLSQAQKEAIRARDNHSCAVCGERANDVDHIQELSTFSHEDLWKANLPSNLQLLCDKHHKKKNKEFAKEKRPEMFVYDHSVSPRANKKRRMRIEGYGIH